MTDIFTNIEDQLYENVKLEVPKFKLRASLINRIMSQLCQDGHDELLKVIRTILRRAGLVSISWDQYTPHWNDGDVCEFGVNDIDTITIGDEEYDRYDFYPLSQYSTDKAKKLHAANPDLAVKLNIVTGELNKNLHQIPESTMQFVFGEGKVTVDKNDYVVEETDHH